MQTMEFQQAAKFLPNGAALLGVVDYTQIPQYGLSECPVHLTALAVIERNVFTPNMFFGLSGVYASPQNDDPLYGAIGLPSRDFLVNPSQIPPEIRRIYPDRMTHWRDNFAYLAYFHFGKPQPIPDTTLMHQGSYFSLLKVTHEKARQ